MKIGKLIIKFKRVKKEYGLKIAIARVVHFLSNVEGRKLRRADINRARAIQGDVLYINGCSVEHPTRYRVLHQIEQLESVGLTCAKVYFEDLELRMEDNFNIFVFYRCECTEDVERFIKRVKNNKKTTFFDIDDLVTDTIYTDQVPFVQELSSQDKKLFDKSVTLTGKTLSMCDIAVTTTEALAIELSKTVPFTFINRNTASKEMVLCSEKAYERFIYAKTKCSTSMVWLGYFSGSLTHNKDFAVIHEVLLRIMEEYEHVGLVLAGELEEGDELQRFSDRILKKKSVSWRELPSLLVEVDINLAPLEDTLFNRCKSEIKWIEAALVRVPTIASRVGAFEIMVKDGVTGELCNNTVDQWYSKLSSLILDKEKRSTIAENAYCYVKRNCITTAKAHVFKDFILNNTKNNSQMNGE